MRCRPHILLAPLALLLLAACMDITGRGPAPLADTVSPDRESSHPLQGEVYCLRGWLGIFSTGIDTLAAKANIEVPAVSVADEEWRRLKTFIIDQHNAGKLRTPLVLIGHSYGADDAIRIARYLQAQNITVDLLITIDPVTPPTLPTNVKRCYNIYKSHPATDAFPFWRGIPIDPASTSVPVTNIDLRTANVGFDTTSIDHINIEKSPGVHDMVLQQLRLVCQPNKPGAHPVRIVSQTK